MVSASIVDSLRPVSGTWRPGSAPYGIRPNRLFATIIEASVGRADADSALTDDVVAGCSAKAGDQAGDQGVNVARTAALVVGSPLGASITRLMSTLVEHVEQIDGRYRLQTMCEGGGMANATIIERL